MLPEAIECQSRIREAATDGEVVRLFNEFVAQIPPAELARLPAECRPRLVADREDIMGLNLQLARAELLGDPSEPHAVLLREILLVTTQAATRFTQLSADGLLGPRDRGA